MTTKSIYKVVKYKDANKFLVNTQSELENDEVFNTFPLWICDVKANSSSANSQAQQSYTALFRDDQLVYVFVCADGNSYVGWYGHQQQQIDTEDMHLVNAIKELLLASVPLAQVSTLHGYSPVVDVFDQLWRTLPSSPTDDFAFTDTTTHQDESTRTGNLLARRDSLWSYQVTNTRDILWTDKTRQLAQRSTLRLATWVEYSFLVNWAEAFVGDCGLTDSSLWNRCAAEIQNGYAYFWCLEDGEPKAMIWKRRALRHGISLAYVYTPKQYRGRGYAATMVAQMTQLLMDKEGYRYVTLLVDGARDPAKNMYTSVGYQLVGSIKRFNYQDDL